MFNASSSASQWMCSPSRAAQMLARSWVAARCSAVVFCGVTSLMLAPASSCTINTHTTSTATSTSLVRYFQRPHITRKVDISPWYNAQRDLKFLSYWLESMQLSLHSMFSDVSLTQFIQTNISNSLLFVRLSESASCSAKVCKEMPVLLSTVQVLSVFQPPLDYLCSITVRQSGIPSLPATGHSKC